MHKVVYLACLSFSGSTLLSFALTNHSKVFTVGHTVGFPVSEGEDFYCSCGELIQECPFFSAMKRAFEEQGFEFSFGDFGTNYRVVNNDRMNWWLTLSLPQVNNATLEHARDRIVESVPGFRDRLTRQDGANSLFIRTAMAYSGADVYVDNSHDPYRWRRLRKIPDLDVLPVQLYRDFRGVALSHMRNKGYDAVTGVRKWIDSHCNVIRVFSEADESLSVYYEKFCADPRSALQPLFDRLDLEWEPLPDDLSATEHHILGNSMRERSITIRRDDRWIRELSEADLANIERVASEFVKSHRNHPLSEVISYYLDTFRRP